MMADRSDREKPGVAFWATSLVLVVLVAYPLSYGPVLRLRYSDRLYESAAGRTVDFVYSPIEVVCDRSEICRSLRSWYLDWCGVLECIARRVLKEQGEEPVSLTGFRNARTRPIESDADESLGTQ